MAPDDGGSPITAYFIEIQGVDGEWFEEETYCDGRQAGIMAATSCTFAILVLKAEPYSQPWGVEIYARVTAINVYGSSLTSDAGNNAIILTVPDKPVNLVNVPSVTLAH
jgi:hypothetical protein